MSTIRILDDEAQWRSREVRYFAGDWDAVQGVMPEFDLVPFTAGPDEPANPFLQTVMRRPLSAVERPVPIGVVSHRYGLAPHRTVAQLCREGLSLAGVDISDLRYEVGISELGEWMNFRIYLPDRYCFADRLGEKLELRLECFNSVDGSSRLVIMFGWLRLVCSNGLVIKETKIEITERHGEGLDLESIPGRVASAIGAAQADQVRLRQWQTERVNIEKIGKWVNDDLAKQWGKKAAARVFHICTTGRDAEIADPFAPGSATEKPMKRLDLVPGSPEHATTVYDVSLALSYVATGRRNAEERVGRQSDIPWLLRRLTADSSGVRLV